MTLDYEHMTQESLRAVVRSALMQIEKDGLPGEHHFFITFRTYHPGVKLPEYLLSQYPEEMTIVLQYQFWGLEVREDCFLVTLSFKDVYERLTIPFQSITTFLDPSVKFGLQFEVKPQTQVSEIDPDDSNVISLEAFRKK